MTQTLIENKEIAARLEVLKEADSDVVFSNKERTLAIMVENQLNKAQHKVSADKLAVFFEAAPTTNTTAVANYDPVLIKMLRRALPNLIAYDVCGVWAMSMPTGLAFYQKARYNSPTGTEALKDEANTAFSGDSSVTQGANTPTALLAGSLAAEGMSTATAEALGDGTNNWGEMSFSIEKISVEAKSRALRADYTVEMVQDLKNVHGLEAQTILADVLSNEILVETNRHVLRQMYYIAKVGMPDTTTAGTWSVTDDSQGRWFQEDAVSLIYALGKDANAINYDVRFGRGNFMIVSCNLADVLAAAEKLDTHEVKIGDVDGAGNTFVGTLGRYKVYIDPYINDASDSFAFVGYKGATELEAGFFYCPYIPLEMYEAVDAARMQPSIAFKSRYGTIANPYSGWAQATPAGAAASSGWYRKSKVTGF